MVTTRQRRGEIQQQQQKRAAPKRVASNSTLEKSMSTSRQRKGNPTSKVEQVIEVKIAAEQRAVELSPDKQISSEEPITQEAYSFEGVSYPSYQDMVNAKRQRNEQVMKALGFLDKKESRQRQPTTKRQKRAQESLPRRTSSRLTSDNADLVALDYYTEKVGKAADLAVVKVEGGGDDNSDDDSTEDKKPRYFKNRLNDGSDMTLKDAIDQMDSPWVEDASARQSKKFVQTELLRLSTSKLIISQCSEPIPIETNKTRLLNMVNDVSVDDENLVAKVTPARVCNVAAHPSEQKLVACAGDKLGYVGLWDVDSPRDDSSNGVHLFRVHSHSICGLEWATSDSMISSSYDGTVRRLHVEKGIFEEIFASYDDSDTFYAEEIGFGLDEGSRFWHQHVSIDHRYPGSNPCLFLATSIGSALHLDLRIREKQRITWNVQCSDKKLNTLSLHKNGYSLASAGTDGVVRLWDIRKFESGRKRVLRPIATQIAGRSINSSYFSPSGGSLLTTSFAHTIDVTKDAHKWKGDNNIPTKRIPHNNKTGRFLSTLQACWHPQHDIFACGSLKVPRRVEIFDEDGVLLRDITGTALNSVTSRMCFHPSTEKLTVIAGNSSGRLIVIR